jgi:hypothetical protein
MVCTVLLGNVFRVHVLIGWQPSSHPTFLLLELLYTHGVEVILRLPDSWPVSLGVRHPSETRDQFFIFVLFFLIFLVADLLMWGALSDERLSM